MATQQHRHESCRDRGCELPYCRIWREAWDEGYREGFDDGQRQGYTDGYAAGAASGRR